MTLVVSIALGLVIGLSLGALGGGGSILTVPALVYVVGQGARAATTSSLFIVGISALIGSLGHARSGRVRWGVGVVFGLTGIAASFAGTAVNRLVDPNVLLLAFAGLVLVAAAGMFAKSRASAPAKDRSLVAAGSSTAGPVPAEPATGADTRLPPRRLDLGRAGKVLAAGLAVGFMTGFFGVGGGFVIVPALTLALGLGMPEAVATSLVVIAINSGAALLARAGTAHFDWAVIVPFTIAAVAGSLTGKTVADRLSAKALTRAFAVLLVAVAIYTATSSLVGLLG
ncbi:MAG TPA: sulfite exporter TauE/SafE family protein [Blastococcus sp.]|jgi:hypothetical protein|nr:sulfite exporter TauE/SafE family protein [Blastococcus sp.]